MDFDELNDLVNELKPEVKEASIEVIVEQSPQIELEPIFANEREASDCGTSKQTDHALDSTF